MKIKVKVDRIELQGGGIQIIVGTPGRVRDMVYRGILKTDFLK